MDELKVYGIIIAILLVIYLAIISPFAFVTHHHTELTVIEKSMSGDGDNFLVWMEDKDGNQYEFENVDSLLRGKVDSSVVQGKLKVGCTYNITTNGYRVPLFSWYENILTYELVEDDAQ